MSWCFFPDGSMGLSSSLDSLLESSSLDRLWRLLHLTPSGVFSARSSTRFFWSESVWVTCNWQSVSQSVSPSLPWDPPSLYLCVDCLSVQAVLCLCLSLWVCQNENKEYGVPIKSYRYLKFKCLPSKVTYDNRTQCDVINSRVFYFECIISIWSPSVPRHKSNL